MIEWWIDIPNLQTVSLPKSFGEIETKSITSIIMNFSRWIDVSRKLAKLVKIKMIERKNVWNERYRIQILFTVFRISIEMKYYLMTTNYWTVVTIEIDKIIE